MTPPPDSSSCAEKDVLIATLLSRLAALEAKMAVLRAENAELRAENARLREKLDEGVTWELKRQLAEVLVDGITIDTVGTGTRREAIVNVRYKFVSSVDTCTDRGSSPPPA